MRKVSVGGVVIAPGVVSLGLALATGLITTALVLGAAGAAMAGPKTPGGGGKGGGGDRGAANPVVLVDNSFTFCSCYSAIESSLKTGTADVYRQYDDEAADDVNVPAGRTWTVTDVEVSGFVFAPRPVPLVPVRTTAVDAEPVSSYVVTFYATGADGRPGAVLSSQRVSPSQVYGGDRLTLPAPVTLPSGQSWVAVQGELDYLTQGSWYWAMSHRSHGSESQWRNPGGGYLTCATWCDTGTDNIFAEETAFRLTGFNRAA